MNLDGSMLFYAVRSRTAGGDLIPARDHTPLQAILNSTDDAVVDVDCDTMCLDCSIIAAGALGAREEKSLRVVFWADEPEVGRGVLITGVDGIEYVGVYLCGRTDLESDPCARCGAETITVSAPTGGTGQ